MHCDQWQSENEPHRELAGWGGGRLPKCINKVLVTQLSTR